MFFYSQFIRLPNEWCINAYEIIRNVYKWYIFRIQVSEILLNKGIFLVNDMQTLPTPSPLPPHKCMRDSKCAEIFAILSYGRLKLLKYFENAGKKNVPKDVQCHETNLCMSWTVVRLVYFQIWSILYSNFLVNWRFRRFQENEIWTICPKHTKIRFRTKNVCGKVYYFLLEQNGQIWPF